MSAEPVTMWEIITAVFIPICGAGFALLWARAADVERKDKADRDEIWNAINVERSKLQQHQVECERRFAEVDELRRLEEKIELRFDRIEAKLDRALARGVTS